MDERCFVNYPSGLRSKKCHGVSWGVTPGSGTFNQVVLGSSPSGLTK
jgi:hypothetical protein